MRSQNKGVWYAQIISKCPLILKKSTYWIFTKDFAWARETSSPNDGPENSYLIKNNNLLLRTLQFDATVIQLSNTNQSHPTQTSSLLLLLGFAATGLSGPQSSHPLWGEPFHLFCVGQSPALALFEFHLLSAWYCPKLPSFQFHWLPLGSSPALASSEFHLLSPGLCPKLPLFSWPDLDSTPSLVYSSTFSVASAITSFTIPHVLCPSSVVFEATTLTFSS